MMLSKILSTCLEIALPRFCVLCGFPLSPWIGLPPWPVCTECALAIRPLAGERCESCGLPLISEIGRCMRCRETQMAFDSAYPLFAYAGSVRELISAYKKTGRRSLAPFIAELFVKVIEEKWSDRIIVPVPPRPGKSGILGWDQVEEIVRCLEGRGFFVARPLERKRSKEQKSLGRGERGANAKMAYALKAGAASPELPLLIDDVVTTCATLDACALALKGGGARSVAALVLAAD